MTGPDVNRRERATAVIAHRGASAEAPENSLAAFELGMALGADAIELDVRRTADGALLVIHDATLERTTDGAGEIAELSRARVAAARLSDGEPVPELEEVLRRFPGVEITIDVKDPRAAADVADLVRRLRRVPETILYVEEGTELAAFRDYEGRRATSTAQALRLARETGWLSSAGTREIPEVVHAPMERDGETIVTQELVRRVRDSGRSVQVWTIDAARVANRLASWGVDGIITNDVRAMRALLDGAASGRKAEA